MLQATSPCPVENCTYTCFSSVVASYTRCKIFCVNQIFQNVTSDLSKSYKRCKILCVNQIFGSLRLVKILITNKAYYTIMISIVCVFNQFYQAGQSYTLSKIFQLRNRYEPMLLIMVSESNQVTWCCFHTTYHS